MSHVDTDRGMWGSTGQGKKYHLAPTIYLPVPEARRDQKGLFRVWFCSHFDFGLFVLGLWTINFIATLEISFIIINSMKMCLNFLTKRNSNHVSRIHLLSYDQGTWQWTVWVRTWSPGHCLSLSWALSRCDHCHPFSSAPHIPLNRTWKYTAIRKAWSSIISAGSHNPANVTARQWSVPHQYPMTVWSGWNIQFFLHLKAHTYLFPS